MIVSVQIISEIRPMTSNRVTAVGGDRAQRFAKGVERAGTDIAVDDADRAERKRQKACAIPCRVFRE